MCVVRGKIGYVLGEKRVFRTKEQICKLAEIERFQPINNLKQKKMARDNFRDAGTENPAKLNLQYKTKYEESIVPIKGVDKTVKVMDLSLIHISEPTRP